MSEQSATKTGEGEQGATAKAGEGGSYGLRAHALTSLETLAQSVANIAPTGTPTLVIPLVFALAGAGTWLAYLISVVGILFVALAINVFAKRSASPGALYTYAAEGLGPAWGVLTGWALFIAYVGTGAAVTTGFSNYGNVIVEAVSGHKLPSVIFIALSVASAWLVAHRDIKLSARLVLYLEFASIALILLLIGASLVRHGLTLDREQLSLKGLSLSNLRVGLVLATFSYVGFEGATALGSEARDPLKSIPRAVLLSSVLLGVLFVLSSYVEVQAFHGEAVALDKSPAPLHVVAGKVGLPFLGYLIDVGAAVSFFSCVLASINAGARVLFFMSRHGFFPGALAGTHREHATPHLAVAVTAVLTFAASGILSLRGAGDFDIYGWVGTVATIAFVLVYIAILVAAPLYLRRRGELTAWHLVSAVVGILFLANGLAGNFYPAPDPPLNWLAYLAVGLVLAGAVWYLALQRLGSRITSNITSDLAAIKQRFEAEVRKAE